MEIDKYRIFRIFREQAYYVLKQIIEVIRFPKPNTVGDEALTWTSWALIAGVLIPIIALTASVFVHPSGEEDATIMFKIIKRLVDENLFLYFAIEIIIAASADYYIIALKAKSSIKNGANNLLKNYEERLLSVSLKYGAFPMVIFSIALVMLFIPNTGEQQETLLSIHLAIFMTTILYVVMVKYRCGHLTEDCYLNRNSYINDNNTTEIKNGTTN